MLGTLFLAAREIAAEQGVAEDGYRVVMNCNSARADGKVKQKIVRYIGIAMDVDELQRLKELGELVKAKLEARHQASLFSPETTVRQVFQARRQQPGNEPIMFDLKQNGYSKDCKFGQPQALLALMVSQGGLPVSYEVFPGATFEGHSLIPVLEELRRKYSLNRVVCVADRGMIALQYKRLSPQVICRSQEASPRSPVRRHFPAFAVNRCPLMIS